MVAQDLCHSQIEYLSKSIDLKRQSEAIPQIFNSGLSGLGIRMKTPTPFSLLIKPASADCNLKCTYCFYLEKCNLYPGTRKHRMPHSVLVKLIQSYMATPQPAYSFVWQGGEPTLMGLDFFRKVTDLQKAFGKTGDVVTNGIQTNATLIDDAFAEHLAQYRFLAGVSLDGPPDIHDRFRQTAGGGPSKNLLAPGAQLISLPVVRLPEI